jgi:hypothetical protein
VVTPPPARVDDPADLLDLAARAAAHEQVMATRHDELPVETWLAPLSDVTTYRRLIERARS